MKRIHDLYLPFTPEQLAEHFLVPKSKERNVSYFEQSVQNAATFEGSRSGRPLSELGKQFQFEKDERFWTTATFMTAFHSKDRTEQLSRLMRNAYGDTPEFIGLASWQECFNDDLRLYFEVDLPSPRDYRDWLRGNLKSRHFIPHILESADGTKKALEGPTQVDAVLVNEKSRFAVLVEAKVLSDISYQITYDVERNQLARNIDVMLGDSRSSKERIARDPDKSLFLLLTPRRFKNKRTEPGSRVYAYKYHEYELNASSMAADLPHRSRQDWNKVTERIGWLTWEDFREHVRGCCPWL